MHLSEGEGIVELNGAANTLPFLQDNALLLRNAIANTMSNSSKVQRWLIDQYQKVAHPPLWSPPPPPHGPTRHFMELRRDGACRSGHMAEGGLSVGR